MNAQRLHGGIAVRSLPPRVPCGSAVLLRRRGHSRFQLARHAASATSQGRSGARDQKDPHIMVDAPTITPTSIPGVGLQHTARFGTSAVAMRDFTAGSLVVTEEPLLVAMWPPLDGPVVAFCRASKEVQHKVLTCIYSPDPATLVGTPILGNIQEVAGAVAADKQVVQALGAASASEAEATALKVMLAWHCNSWGWGFQGYNSALFEVGSKLAHTCGTANTVHLSFDVDDQRVPASVRGKGCFMARRDISAGELLSVSYNHPKYVPHSALARRHRLHQNFGFVCECETCRSGVDRYRGLPCPVCAADVRDSDTGLIRLDVVTGRQAPKGVVWCDLSKVAAGDPAPWACDACGAMLPDDERLLLGPDAADRFPADSGSIEEQLFMLCQIWGLKVNSQEISLADVKSRWSKVARIMGPAHWSTYHLYGMLSELHARELSQYSLDLVKSKGVEEVVRDMRWHLEELQEQLDKIWGFMNRTATYKEAAWAVTIFYQGINRQLLDAAEANLLPARTANGIISGSGSSQPVLEVQHQLAQLAGVLLRRIGPSLEATRGWDLPLVRVYEYDAYSQRCEHLLALPVVTLEEATRLERGAKTGVPDGAVAPAVTEHTTGKAGQSGAAVQPGQGQGSGVQPPTASTGSKWGAAWLKGGGVRGGRAKGDSKAGNT